MPLTGLKVVEACSNISGPLVGTILGDLGAHVVKIEKPVLGDDVRGWSPPDWNGISARFRAINRNKTSLVLDLREEGAVRRLRELIADADVFVHNMRPGAVDSLGLSSTEAMAFNPRLIYCAIGAFGSRGPWKTRSAYDGLAQALSSQMAGNGLPDSEPTLVSDALVDKGAGMWAIIGILSALVRRQSTGRGGVVETSLLEAALFWRDSAFAQYLASGTPPKRPGNASGNVVPYGVFKTKDRPIMIGCAGDALFATFARLLDHAEWVTDPRFAKNSKRVANRATLEPLIEEALLSRTVDEWVELLGTNCVPCSPILGTDEAYSHPQVQALGIFQSPPDVDTPIVSAPWSLDGLRPLVRSGAPVLGEYNEILDQHATARSKHSTG